MAFSREGVQENVCTDMHKILMVLDTKHDFGDFRADFARAMAVSC
jgi:hypothetical protein